MRHRKTHRRLFVLQLHDRIEPPPDQSPASFPDHVRSVLQGHALECSYCGVEPEFKSMEQTNHAQPVHSWNGLPVGIASGHTTTTLKAACHKCNCTITYDIDPTGLSTATGISYP